MVSAWKASLERVAVLERQAAQVGDMALHRADPALLRDDDGDRLALDHRRLDVLDVVLRRLGEGRAAAAERRVRAERLAHLPDLVGDRLPLLVLGLEQRLDARSAPWSSSSCSLRISISSSLRRLRSRMLRIASACTSVSLKRFIITGFGSSSSRMMRITSSRLR